MVADHQGGGHQGRVIGERRPRGETCEQEAPGRDRGRRAGGGGAGRGTRPARRVVRAGRALPRAAADPQGTKSHPAHPRALLFLGCRRRVASGASDAPRLPDQRDHRLRQPDERVLVRTAATRARAPLLLPGQRPPAPVPDGGGAAEEIGRASRRREPVRMDGADDRAGRQRRAGRYRRARGRRATGSGGRLRGGLRRGPLDRPRAGRHRAQRRRLRPADGAGGVPFTRAARRPQAFPGALHLQCAAPGVERLLAVLRPGRCRRGLVLPRPGAG